MVPFRRPDFDFPPTPPPRPPLKKVKFEAEYSFFVRQAIKQADKNKDGNLSASEALAGSRELEREGDINMANILKALAQLLARRNPNDDIFKDGLLSYVSRRRGEPSEFKRLAGTAGTDQVFSMKDVYAPHPVFGSPISTTRPDGFPTARERQQFDQWIKLYDLNEFGDPKDIAYLGGTPLFDERTGKRIPLFKYVTQNYPDRPWRFEV